MDNYCRIHDIYDCWFNHTVETITDDERDDLFEAHRQWSDERRTGYTNLAFEVWLQHDESRLFQDCQRWMTWQPFDEYGCDESYQPSIDRNGRMGVAGATYDNRDAICGSWFRAAPPAQQYGFRMTLWLTEQACHRALDSLPVSNEPF